MRQKSTGRWLLSSNHFSSQQLNNHPTNRPFFFPNMPMLNSHTFQSASGVNTITRPVPKRSGGDYPSGQQVVVTNLVSFWWRLICFDLDSWYGLHWPPFDPGVQDSWNGRLFVGSSPLQPRRVGETQGSRTNQSTPTILVENHRNGGDLSGGRGEGHGRLYLVHEALFSHRNETLEDVERDRESSEFLAILSWINSSSNIFLTGWSSWKPDECHRTLDFCLISRSFKLFLFLLFMEHLLYFLLFIFSNSHR